MNLVKGDRSKEGSRGGHVIGHTSSGKPIYASHAGNFKAHTKDWSKQDHADAASLHGKLEGKHKDAEDIRPKCTMTGRILDQIENTQICLIQRITQTPRRSADTRQIRLLRDRQIWERSNGFLSAMLMLRPRCQPKKRLTTRGSPLPKSIEGNLMSGANQ